MLVTHAAARSTTLRPAVVLDAPGPMLAQLASRLPIGALWQHLPPSTVLDGELVVADQHGQPDFGALQSRLTMNAPRISDAALNCSAVLVVFDILELGGETLVDCPLEARRRRLEHLLDGLHPCLQLVLETADPKLGN
jgi:ATP-dependent DNA ligase